MSRRRSRPRVDEGGVGEIAGKLEDLLVRRIGQPACAPVDFDRANISSYAGFGRTFDLFGDGSIRLAFTPGHSAGHMSVICRLAERDFVIGGDCVYLLAQLDGDENGPPRPQDAHNYRRSLQELRLFRRQLPDAIVTPGHDPDFYGRIEQRYE